MPLKRIFLCGTPAGQKEKGPAAEPLCGRPPFFPPQAPKGGQKAGALPGGGALRDAVFNVSRVALMAAAMTPRALASGEGPNALLYAATQDRLHQPYRKGLMQPSWDLIQAFRSRGFAAMVSGAGPCVLVLHHGDAVAYIAEVAAKKLASGHWKVLHLPIDTVGVQVERK